MFIVIASFESITVFNTLLLIMIAVCPFKFYMMYKQRVVRKEFERQLKEKAKLEKEQAKALAEKQS